MYEEFFKLSAEPFRLSPDHHFCFRHAQYAKARAYMDYAFRRAEGFVMVTGQPGTGKTTLIGDLVDSLAAEEVQVAKLVSTQLAADELLRMVGYAFGLDAESVEKSTLLRRLNELFLQCSARGHRALLIVDEAQDLSHTAMEELRLLTNMQLDGEPLLQIFLLGQPELRELIHGPGMEQVQQRIVATSHLEALDVEETRAYVEHRLGVVGWRNDPAISASVYPIIHAYSAGVPRRVNLFCSRLLLHCFVEQLHQVSVADARIVAAELEEEKLSSGADIDEALFTAVDVYDYVLEVPDPESLLDAGEESAAEAEASQAELSGTHASRTEESQAEESRAGGGSADASLQQDFGVDDFERALMPEPPSGNEYQQTPAGMPHPPENLPPDLPLEVAVESSPGLKFALLTIAAALIAGLFVALYTVRGDFL